VVSLTFQTESTRFLYNYRTTNDTVKKKSSVFGMKVKREERIFKNEPMHNHMNGELSKRPFK